MVSNLSKSNSYQESIDSSQRNLDTYEQQIVELLRPDTEENEKMLKDIDQMFEETSRVQEFEQLTTSLSAVKEKLASLKQQI